MKIGEQTLKKGWEMLTLAMLSYKTKLNEAFLKNGEKDLKIGLSLTIEPGPATGNFKLKVGIDFVTEKVKDSFTSNFEQDQLDLFEEPEKHRHCPVENMRVLDSYCAEKCAMRKEVLIPDAERPDFVQYRSCAAWADEDTAAAVRFMVAGCETIPAEGETNGQENGTDATESETLPAADPDPCQGCAYLTTRGRKGVPIPNRKGGCLRTGGLCDVMLDRIGEAS